MLFAYPNVGTDNVRTKFMWLGIVASNRTMISARVFKWGPRACRRRSSALGSIHRCVMSCRSVHLFQDYSIGINDAINTRILSSNTTLCESQITMIARWRWLWNSGTRRPSKSLLFYQRWSRVYWHWVLGSITQWRVRITTRWWKALSWGNIS